MIIPNSLIKLDYDPARDVLFVEWPDFQHYALEELKYILESIIEAIKYYDISNLLIDARTTTVSIDKEDYELLAQAFIKELTQTRLKKLARLTTDSAMREQQVQEMVENTNYVLGVQFKSCTNINEAIAWLSAPV